MEYLIGTDDYEILIESQKRNICEEVVDKLCKIRNQKGMTQQDVANATCFVTMGLSIVIWQSMKCQLI